MTHIFQKEDEYIKINKYKNVQIKNMHGFSIMFFIIAVISYAFIINFSPIEPDSSNQAFVYTFNQAPFTISMLSFTCSIIFFLFGWKTILRKRILNIFQGFFILFLFINPLSIKQIITPGDNILYALSIMMAYRFYLIFQSKESHSKWICGLLLLSGTLISYQTLFIFMQIMVIDYMYHIFVDKNDYNKKPIDALALIFSISVISLYFYNVTIDDISSSISQTFTSFTTMSFSVWIVFTFIFLLVFVSFCLKNVKKENLFVTNSAFVIFLTIVGCFYQSSVFYFPFLLVLLGFSFFYIDNVSSLYSKVFSTALVIFMASSYFSVLNNYRIQMIMSQSIYHSIESKLDTNKSYYLIGDIPHSPILKKNDLYPNGYWDSLYFSSEHWIRLAHQSNILLFKENDSFMASRLGMDFYNKNPENETRYYKMIEKNNFSYIFFKKS